MPNNDDQNQVNPAGDAANNDSQSNGGGQPADNKGEGRSRRRRRRKRSVKDQVETQPVNPFMNIQDPDNDDVIEPADEGDQALDQQSETEVEEQIQHLEPQPAQFEEATPPPPNPFSDFSVPKDAEPEKPEKAETVVTETTVREEKEEKQEVIDVAPAEASVQPAAPVAEASPAPESLQNASEGFNDDFWDILRQAGITKGRIVTLLIVIIIVIVGFWGFLQFRKVSNVVENVKEEVQEQVDNVEKVARDAFESTSEFLGFERAERTDYNVRNFVDAAYGLGYQRGSSTIRFVQYIDLLAELNNIFATDIYALLDLSLDRRGALDSFLVQMLTKIEEAESVLAEIEAELARLDADFEFLIDERDFAEEVFFNATENLRGQQAFDSFNSFLALELDATAVKARFNALRTVGEMYLNAINVLRPRYEDIVLNREAIIKGIRVFDVPDSDIDAIIPLLNNN